MPLNPMVGTGKISPFIWSVSKPGAPRVGGARRSALRPFRAEVRLNSSLGGVLLGCRLPLAPSLLSVFTLRVSQCPGSSSQLRTAAHVGNAMHAEPALERIHLVLL